MWKRCKNRKRPKKKLAYNVPTIEAPTKKTMFDYSLKHASHQMKTNTQIDQRTQKQQQHQQEI